MYRTVMDEVGKPIVFNICMLGAVIGLTDVISPEAVMKALTARIPRGFIDLNKQALEMGLEMGRNAKP
jgi:2-oxoglutarate ferredoxin oxidoreductase subunit gamma